MAEKVIKAEDIAEKDLFRDMTDSAKNAIPVMKELSDILAGFLHQTKEQVKSNPLGSAQDINGLTSAWNGATSAAQQKLKIDKEIAVVQAQIEASFHAESNSLSANAVKLAENRLSRAELNKEIKQTAILRKAEEGSLEALRVKLSQATKELDKMSAATLKTAAGLAQIEKVKNVSLAISEVEQASGRFYRNVGNYKSGYDGLAASINQLTREAPSAAVSMNTFFLAISNNIPMLVDQINQIKKANVELAESGKPTVSVIGKIASALFSWQTLISAGITLLTVFGGKIIDYISGTKEAEKSTIDWTSALEQNRKTIDGLLTSLKVKLIDLRLARGEINKEEADSLKIQENALATRKQYYDEYATMEKDFRAKLKEARGGKDAGQDILDVQQKLYDSGKYHQMGKGFKEYFDALYQMQKQYKQKMAILAESTDTESELKTITDTKKDPAKTKADSQEKIKTLDEINKEEFQHEMDMLRMSDEAKRIELEKQYIAGTLSEKQYQDALFIIKQESLQTQLNLERVYHQDSSNANQDYYDNEVKKFEDYQKKQQKVLTDAEKANEDLAKIAYQSNLNKEKDIEDRKKEATKDRIAREKKLFDTLEQISNTRYTNEEKRLDRTIANSQRQQQTLALLAQQGVDNAKESLAAEQKIQADAEAKRAELQKKKERTEFAMTVLKMTTANLEANQGDPAKALIDTGVQVGALIALIQGLPSFFVGTEDTGSGGGLDGKGGFLSVLHPNERVMTAEQNAMIGDISNKEAAKVLSMYNAGLMPQVAYMPNYNSTQSSDVVKELREVKDAIKQIEIPIQSWAYDATEKAIIERVETRTKIITNHIKPKSGIWS